MSEREGLPPELESLACEVGDFICYWGFKKIHGRIWTHIFLSKDPLDAGQLMRRLRVSKALMSLSINDLLKYDVIVESGKSTRGTQTYVANPEVLDVILNVLRRREQKMLAKAEASQKKVASLAADRQQKYGLATERIDLLGRMVTEAQNVLSGLLELATLDLKPLEELNEGGKKFRQSP